MTPERGIDQAHKKFRVEGDSTPARRLATTAPDAVTAVVDDVVIAAAADAHGASFRMMPTKIWFGNLVRVFRWEDWLAMAKAEGRRSAAGGGPSTQDGTRRTEILQTAASLIASSGLRTPPGFGR